jgi:hypothetical protein
MGLSYLVDGIFNTNTLVYLTHNWSAVAYYEHVWTPQWRTSLYGGLLGTNWGSGAIAQVCAVPSEPVGFSAGNQGVFQNLNTPGFPTNQAPIRPVPPRLPKSIITKEMCKTAILIPVGRSWHPDDVEPGAGS